MDPNQTPTPQPDYNFIVNQPSPDGVEPGQPKKRSKKVIILIILLALTVIIGAFVIFLPDNKQQENTALVFEDNQPKTLQEDAVRRYLTYLSDDQYGAAYGMLAPEATLGEESNVQESWFISEYAPASTSYWEASPCIIGTPNPEQPNTIESLCRSVDGQFAIARTYQIVENNGASVIKFSKATGVRDL